MKLIVGQAYDTVSMGKVKILDLDFPGPYKQAVPSRPLLAGTPTGGLVYFTADGKSPGSPQWDIVAPKSFGYINIFSTKAAAEMDRTPGQITVPFEYAVEGK